MMLLWTLSFVGGPAVQGLISKRYGPDEQGAVQGGLSGIQSLTGVFAPLIATNTFRYFTSETAPMILPGAPYLLGAVLSIVAIGLALWALLRRRSDRVATATPEAA